jgi:cytochrome oxidase Cu insertion factor (SCO1/SenC/PrrC family)
VEWCERVEKFFRKEIDMSNENMRPIPRKKVHPWTVPGLLIVVALGFVVGYNYLVNTALKTNEMAGASGRLPYMSRLEQNLKLQEKSGEAVELMELKGKVLIASFLFTRCPSGCAGIQAEVGEIAREFAAESDNIHFLSFSLDPEHDTPEILAEFSATHELGAPNWWFMTGDPAEIRDYMTSQFQFYAPQLKPEAERMHEGDLYTHDMRIALVDHQGHIRGYYPILQDELFRTNIREDIRQLLQDQAADKKK